MNLQPLPIGTSDFSALRSAGQIYVDKTEFVYELASERQKYFLARPRRFGKSLLISTFETLFRDGLKNFEGLKIEKLWKEVNTFSVVRLDFSRLKSTDRENFDSLLAEYLSHRFSAVGFAESPGGSILNQLEAFLMKLPDSSLVVLIDEYDAPLTTVINDKLGFARVREALSAFFALLKSNDRVIRFLFLTGITKFNKLSIFSELNNLNDISLSPRYGSLLGYTHSEVKEYFSDYLLRASKLLGLDEMRLLDDLTKQYDGFCFEETARQKVFAPWSLLKFMAEPERGLKNYWFESGGKSSVLIQHMKTHILSNPEDYAKTKSIALSHLSGSSDVDGLSDVGLLTQAGYLTIKNVEYETAFVGYPNREVSSSMAQLYTEQILDGRNLVQVGASDVIRELFAGNAEAVFQLLNKAFLSIDYKNYPVRDESSVRALAQVFLSSFGLEPSIKVHNHKGRSDLEVRAGITHWVFEFKVVREGESSEKRLEEAVSQVLKQDYGKQHHVQELNRMVLIYSLQGREFVKWQLVD